MKYGINEGQWVQFVNSLPAAARVNRDLSDNNHKNSTNVVNRNTISCSGTPLLCSTQRPSRAVSYLSWMDLAAFLDWDALRPMTELEFEKMSRGPLVANAGEYIWGNQTITAATTISGTTEDGTETITHPPMPMPITIIPLLPVEMHPRALVIIRALCAGVFLRFLIQPG